MKGGNLMTNLTIKANAEALVLNDNYKVIADKKFTKAITLQNKHFITAYKCDCCDRIVFCFDFENQKIQVNVEDIAIS